MDTTALVRIEARRHKLELVLLAAMVSGCGPEELGPVADTGTTTNETSSNGTSSTETSTTENNDEGIVPETDTETGSAPDPEICFVVIDAVGAGDCTDVLGYRWATGGCESVRGCSCEGVDCNLLYATSIECEGAYLHCDLCAPCPDPMSCVVHCDGTGITSSIECGGGCWDGEMAYDCPMDDLDQPADVDLECSGLGRVVLRQRAVTQLGAVASTPGRAWAAICACEQASVLGFERLATQLGALGAPTELIENARRFAADERRHAAATLAIARRFDPEIDPPRLPPEPSTSGLAALLEETILAGCIGETLSALELEHMSAACRDQSLASVLAEIADDEARHAEHAWVLLAWLLRRFPALRDPAMQLLRRDCATVPLGLDRDLPELGLLADGTRAELWDAGRRRVVDRLAAQVLALAPEPVERSAISPGPILC
jgi:hypothetical protein